MKTDFIEIFQTIRAEMQPYTVEGFKNTTDSDSAYHLATEEHVVQPEQNKDEVYFFGLEINADHVALCFNPIYTTQEINSLFGADLLNLIVENNCFRIEKLDDLLLEQISNALAASFKYYKQKGWV